MANSSAASAEVAQNLANADKLQGLPETGDKALTTEHATAGTEHHADPSVFGMDATVWVSVAMLVFFAILIWQKVPALLVRGLDGKIALSSSGDVIDVKSHKIIAKLKDEYGRNIHSEKFLDMAFDANGHLLRVSNQFAQGLPDAVKARTSALEAEKATREARN